MVEIANPERTIWQLTGKIQQVTAERDAALDAVIYLQSQLDGVNSEIRRLTQDAFVRRAE